MALASYDPVIPLDEVIETAQRVAGQMPRELRCTALGGLSITPTSKAIEQRLAVRKAAPCGLVGRPAGAPRAPLRAATAAELKDLKAVRAKIPESRRVGKTKLC